MPAYSIRHLNAEPPLRGDFRVSTELRKKTATFLFPPLAAPFSVSVSLAWRAVTVASMPCDTVNMQQGLTGSGHTDLSSPFSIKPKTTN